MSKNENQFFWIFILLFYVSLNKKDKNKFLVDIINKEL